MSHFVFGIIEGSREPGRLSVESTFDVLWGVAPQQKVVLEMLASASKPAPTETPFSLTRTGEDNADGLISPYQVEREPLISNVCDMITWLDQKRAGKNAELWLTEGYDDAFRVIRGSAVDMKAAVRAMFENSVEIASIRIALA
jgi:hypothetical protein